MLKSVKLLVASAALATAASASYAAVQPGAYIGLGLGYSNVEKQSLDVFSAEKKSQDTSGMAGRIFTGYRFNDYLAAELGYTKFADSKYKLVGAQSTQVGNAFDAKAKQELSAIDIIGKAFMPISDSNFSIYGLAGAAYVTSKVSGDVTDRVTEKTGSFSHTTHAWRPKFGAGVSYAFPAEHITTSFEVTRIVGGNKHSDKYIPTTDAAMFTVAYDFN